MHAAVEPWTRDGTPYAEFLKACVAQRMFRAALGREEEYLAIAVERRRAGPWPVELEYTDGRWLLVNFARLSNGGSITYGLDITERKLAEESLRRQTERLLIGQRTASMVIMDWDIGRDELSWSDSPEWLRGPLPPGGKYPLYKDQIHPEDRERFLAIRALGIENQQRHDHEYRVIRTDGQMLWIRSERVVLPGPDGKAARMLVALHNITQRKKAELELQSLNDGLERRVAERTAALETAYRDLESFSYSVSHDLRSPLRAIAGFANILRDQDADALSDEGRRCLSVIEGNALRMSALIDALLKLAHNSRHAMALERIDMAALAREAYGELSGEYPAARVEIAALPPSLGDASLVRQVWTNLIDNALKYSAAAPPSRIEVGTLASADGAAYFVRDNGIGFDMAHAGNLFAPFHRLHTDAKYPGDGIGLALAGQIVQRHGGRIWAESLPGQGATFYFTLARATPKD
jgi:signal transduction histidine kinase